MRFFLNSLEFHERIPLWNFAVLSVSKKSVKIWKFFSWGFFVIVVDLRIFSQNYFCDLPEVLCCKMYFFELRDFRIFIKSLSCLRSNIMFFKPKKTDLLSCRKHDWNNQNIMTMLYTKHWTPAPTGKTTVRGMALPSTQRHLEQLPKTPTAMLYDKTMTLSAIPHQTTHQ